jgi:hypothetical protein
MCYFGAMVVAYLGHVITEQGITMDVDKVEEVRAWPPQHTVRGILKLMGYYRKFIRSSGEIATPLTQLLKREAFR